MGTLNEDLSAIKEVEDKIIANKVARFAYTEEAYTTNDANGVAEYDVSKEQNIPTADASVLKVNETVLSKGYRAQASSITRMLVNHFFGRMSYNLNKVNDIVSNLITTLIGHRGTANGFATLDENGRIPFSQLPESAIEYKGNWNAETNEPPLSDGMGGATSGDFYIVAVAGTQNLGSGEITFLVNDRIIYNKENKWEKLAGGNVRSVNGKEPDNATGNITLYGTDIPTSETEGVNIIEKIKQYVGSTLLGRYWTQSNKTGGDFSGRARYANGIWVACSGSGAGLWYSTDGKNWAQSNKPDDSFLGGARYANGIWVACSGSGSGSSSTGNGLWYSTDGKNWAQSNNTDGSFSGGARYANGIWVACSGSGAGLWYSTDGKNWAQSNKTSGIYQGGARYANGVWVACGSSGNGLWYSTDGKNWAKSNKPDMYYQGGARYANGVWVACGSSSTGNGLWYSTDGKNWTQSNKTDGNFSGGARYANGIWVACSGKGNGLWYSTDGKNWAQSNKANNSFSGGARYANGIWVVCGKGNGLWYSTDGRNWTQSNKTDGNFQGGARYANGIWVACSDNIGLWYSDVQTLIDNGWLK